MDDEITKCSECEALMLERTAIKYDGKCIPCSKGYRKDIENSKIYYEEQKNRLQLPESVYWRELCEITSDPERGFESLDENEKLYYAVCLLEGEIYNGGFEQYFTNSSSDHFDHAIRALEVLTIRYH